MISAAIFTFNEEMNLPYCLQSLKSCDDIVVIDSYSTDQTREIAKSYGAKVFQHNFTGFGDQRMWALQNISFRYPWVLILDADEQVPPALWEEIKSRIASCQKDVAAFRLKRRFFWEDAWLRYANLYPSWVVRLIRVGKVTYINRGHAETQSVDGKIEALKEDLIDKNHKGLAAWRQRQQRYAEEEACAEISLDRNFCLADLWSRDPLKHRALWKILSRKLPCRGLCYFVYAYFLRGGWLDGWVGLRFCFEKARFQTLTARLASKLKKSTAT